MKQAIQIAFYVVVGLWFLMDGFIALLRTGWAGYSRLDVIRLWVGFVFGVLFLYLAVRG